MIMHVYERVLHCRCLDRVTVATDDSRIADAVKEFGGECVLTRADHQSGTDRIAEAADILGLDEDDIVVNIQGDEALLEPEMIERLIAAMTDSPSSPMATLAYPSTSRDDFIDQNVVKVVADRDGKALYFSRSSIPFPRDGADRPPAFLKHMGFYAYRRWFLRQFTTIPAGELELVEKLEQLRALENGYPILVALSPVDSQSVDTPADLAKVLAILKDGD